MDMMDRTAAIRRVSVDADDRLDGLNDARQGGVITDAVDPIRRSTFESCGDGLVIFLANLRFQGVGDQSGHCFRSRFPVVSAQLQVVVDLDQKN